MAHTYIMPTLYACWVVFSLVRAIQGRTIGGFAGGMTAMAPIYYMTSHMAPDMNSPLLEWLLAIIDIAGPLAVAGVLIFRRALRAADRIPA